MTSAAKMIIATGASSGLGFELVKQLLLDQPTPFKFILGVRDPSKSKPQFDSLRYDTSKHDISLHKVDFANLREVRTFAREAIATLGKDKLDYVLLNHGMAKGANGPGEHGSPWSESFVVNHQSHHYLMHLLREPILASHSRVVFISSGAIRMVEETGRSIPGPRFCILIIHTDSLRPTLLANSGKGPEVTYPTSKFVQLLAVHHWRRALGDQATVVCVSPGMIPGTGLGRNVDSGIPEDHPDAKDVPTGAKSMLAALYRDDLPKDPNAVFLTSWGEWWDPNEIYPLSLDTKLQDEWCPPKDEIEREAKL